MKFMPDPVSTCTESGTFRPASRGGYSCHTLPMYTPVLLSNVPSRLGLASCSCGEAISMMLAEHAGHASICFESTASAGAAEGGCIEAVQMKMLCLAVDSGTKHADICCRAVFIGVCVHYSPIVEQKDCTA